MVKWRLHPWQKHYTANITSALCKHLHRQRANTKLAKNAERKKPLNPLTGLSGGLDLMKSRISSWAFLFTLVGISPSTWISQETMQSLLPKSNFCQDRQKAKMDSSDSFLASWSKYIATCYKHHIVKADKTDSTHPGAYSGIQSCL